MSGYEVVSKTVSMDGSDSVIVACPAGKLVLGGGASASLDSVNISTSRPISNRQWLVAAKGDGAFELTAYAICAQAAD